MIRTSFAPLALGAALAAALVASPLAAQVRAPATAGLEKATPADPCCTVQTVNRRTGVVVALDRTTGKTFTLRVTDRGLLRRIRPGQAVHGETPPECTGSAASAGGTTSCGSNVPRDANTKTCWIAGPNGEWIRVQCDRS